MRRAQRIISPIWPLFAGAVDAIKTPAPSSRPPALALDELESTTLTNVPPVAPALVGTIKV